MKKTIISIALVILLAFSGLAFAEYILHSGSRGTAGKLGESAREWKEIHVETIYLDGTALATTAAELNQYVITVDMTDISTGASVWVVAPHAGTITAIYSVINGAIITADATITAEIATVAVTGSSITIAHSGSAAGTVDSSTPTAANVVTAGQAIEIITDGGSTNTVRATFSIVISR